MKIKKSYLFFKIACIFFSFGLIAEAESLETQENMPLKSALIPSGKYLMGTKDGNKEERPIRNVWVDAFYIDKFEVSKQEFNLFRQITISNIQSECKNCPATLVSWYEAESYCRFKGGRLPTEAEWEKAARGPQKWNFSFGPNIQLSKGHFEKTFNTGPVPVDTFSPNEYGLHHMSGNVWEWVSDWFGAYAEKDKKNPKGPNSGTQKVIRGGGWYNPGYYTHVGRRFKLAPQIKLNAVGFRCAYDVSEKPGKQP